MKIAIAVEEQSAFGASWELLETRLRESIKGETKLLFMKQNVRKPFINELKGFAPDVLVTTDLAGFEQCTLTDNISYNLLSCKQIHLLLHENLPYEKYLEKQLSIAMFFYCVGDAYYDALKNKYPNLPYLKKIQGWQIGEDEHAMEKNAEILSAILQEVSVECGMACTT